MMRGRMRAVGIAEVTLEGMLGMGDKASVRILLQFLRETGLIGRI